MKKILLGLALLSSSPVWADMDVTVDVTGLTNAQDRYANSLYIPGISAPQYSGTKTFTIPDGDYELRPGAGSGMNTTYGSFNVTGTTLTVTAGALTINDSSTLGFDLTKLGRVEFDNSELGSMVHDGSPKMPAIMAMTGVGNNIRGDFYTYLPDYPEIKLLTRSSAVYGSFALENGQITNIQGALYQEGVNSSRLHFDRNKLAPVRVMAHKLSSPEKMLLTAVHEVAGGNLGDYVVFMPPGTHKFGTRYYPGIYGNIIVDEFLNLTTDGYVVVGNANITPAGISHTEITVDFTSTPHIDVYNSELSDPVGLTAVGLYQAGNGVRGETYTRYYLPDSQTNGNPVTYRLSQFGALAHAFYGDVTLSTSTPPSSTGTLITQDSEVHFDTCALNKVNFSSATNNQYHLGRWATGWHTSPVSIYVPNGADFLVSSAGQALNVVVSGSSVSINGDFNGTIDITSEEGHCTPPDTDEDNVLDDMDECPDTLAGKKVDSYGCSVNQNIALTCDATKSKNHGRYVSCVSHVLDDLIDQLMISVEDKGSLMSEVAKKK